MTRNNDFFGFDFTQEEYAKRMVQCIDLEKDALHEKHLMRIKWFDYRFEHPTRSTYRFADAYSQAYRTAYAANFDSDGAKKVKGFKGKDLFDQRVSPISTIRGMWRARQWADGLGMPYSVYCQLGMEWSLRRQRRFLPRPSHLCNFNLMTAINNSWQERQVSIVYKAEHEFFHNAHYCGLAPQDAHHDWLFRQVDMRQNGKYLLGSLLKDQLLPAEKAIERYGQNLYQDALSA